MHIRSLSLDARLGCTAEERSVPQEIRVSVELRFFEAPPGVLTDDLNDTICHAKVSEALNEHLRGREFNLVEKMASEFYGVLKKRIEGRAELALTLHKVKPPVSRL